MSITYETRRAAHEEVKPKLDAIRGRVYAAVAATEGLTAEEIHKATGINLNSCRSRATELYNDGKFVVLSKRFNESKTRMIAVYSVPKEGQGTLW